MVQEEEVDGSASELDGCVVVMQVVRRWTAPTKSHQICILHKFAPTQPPKPKALRTARPARCVGAWAPRDAAARHLLPCLQPASCRFDRYPFIGASKVATVA